MSHCTFKDHTVMEPPIRRMFSTLAILLALVVVGIAYLKFGLP